MSGFLKITEQIILHASRKINLHCYDLDMSSPVWNTNPYTSYFI